MIPFDSVGIRRTDALKRHIKKIARKLGIIKAEVPTSKEEQWRARGVKFGDNFHAPDSAIDYCFGFLVNIGNNVTLSGTTVLAHDASTKKTLGYSKVAPVSIGNDVFVGYGSIILPGVTIGNKVIVGAGTIVSKDIPDNVVVVRGVSPPIEYYQLMTNIWKKKRKDYRNCPCQIYCFPNVLARSVLHGRQS